MFSVRAYAPRCTLWLFTTLRWWRTDIFAGVNNMKSPELQAAGIGVITTVADMLLIAEMEALYSALTDCMASTLF